MGIEVIAVIVLVVVGGAFWYFNKEAASNVAKGVKAEVQKLPTPAKLKAQTKNQLEELGRQFGIELDKRKNKDKMIADLKSGVKAQQK